VPVDSAGHLSGQRRSSADARADFALATAKTQANAQTGRD
jgi:hypothetical protein